MTDATRQIIRAALAADATMSDADRARAMCALEREKRPKERAAPDCGTYTAPEAARLLRVSVATVNRMKRDGSLAVVRVGGKNRIAVRSLRRFTA